MKKVFLQGLTIIVLFFLTWFLLSQIDWYTIFKIKKVTDKTEEKLGDLFLNILQKTEKENKNTFVINVIDSIVNKICLANKIDREIIKIHIINKDEINAFALPNGHLLVYSGLILSSENQEELSGVICHEIAHIELNHIMKKLIKEVGLTALISMTAGNNGTEIIKQTVKLLSSSAFDRSLEKAADIKAIDYLVKSKINPQPFANFLYALAEKENESDKYFAWISSHPESKERGKYITEYSKTITIKYEPILSLNTWDKLKEKLLE